MTSTRKRAKPAARWMGVLGAAVVAAPGLAKAGPLDLLYERSVMSVANQRCALFAPDVAAALASGVAQARGAALRAGTAGDVVRNVERNARRKAMAASCGSKDIAIAAGRVRTAFAGFAKLVRLNYPGDIADWNADRTGAQAMRWRLKQDAAFGSDKMNFGLVGRDGSTVLLAIGRFADGAQPYAARLLLRDDSRSTGPYLDRRGNGPTANLPLARRLPPRSMLKAYPAQARSPAGTDLLPKGESQGWAFRFSEEATQALARLDPREAAAVEFLFAGRRETVRQAYVEVGDFAAGRAFVQIAAR